MHSPLVSLFPISLFIKSLSIHFPLDKKPIWFSQQIKNLEGICKSNEKNEQAFLSFIQSFTLLCKKNMSGC